MNRKQAEKLLAALVFDDLDESSKAELLAYLQTDAAWTFSSPLVDKVDGFQTYGVYGDGRFNDMSADNPDFDDLTPQAPEGTPQVSWN